jgi:hypothetical protein
MIFDFSGLQKGIPSGTTFDKAWIDANVTVTVDGTDIDMDEDKTTTLTGVYFD